MKKTVFQMCGACDAVTRHNATDLKNTEGQQIVECSRCGSPRVCCFEADPAQVADSVRLHGARELNLLSTIEVPSLKGALKAAHWAALNGNPEQLRDALATLHGVAAEIYKSTALLAGVEVEVNDASL